MKKNTCMGFEHSMYHESLVTKFIMSLASLVGFVH